MPHRPDPFAIREVGGDIQDRSVSGFSSRRLEGTNLGEPGLATLRRVISQRVPWIMAVCLILALIGLVARLGKLQLIDGAAWRNIAEGNRIRFDVVPAARGIITDRHGRHLAYNVPSFNLVVLPAELPSEDPQRQEILNDVLGSIPTELLDQDAITSLGQLSYLPRVIASGISRELAIALSVKIATHTGFNVVAVGERAYEGGEALGHILGYVGRLSQPEYAELHQDYQLTDSIGKSGFELQNEGMLRGRPGTRRVEVDARGRERKVFATEAPTPGVVLEATIDLELQELTYRLLERAGTRAGGSIIVLDAVSGELYALTSYPGFNPNAFTIARDSKVLTEIFNDARRPLFNRAIAGQYPPGSTIKPFIGAAALSENIINPQTSIISSGGVAVGDQFFSDWKPGGHGPTNIYRAIAESVNTFFYLVGGGSDTMPGLGINRLANYLTRFGFGRTTGLALAGEANGLVPTPGWKTEKFGDRWYRGDTYNVSIGQGNLTVTPLQLAAAYATLVNGGQIIQPRLIRTITYPDGRVEHPSVSRTYSTGISPEVTKVLATALRQTVTIGSGRALVNAPITVAGKTGTAQAGTNRAPHAWFAGYAPATKPEIVVVVMVEHGGEGSVAAVPIAREVFSWYAQNRPSPP